MTVRMIKRRRDDLTLHLTGLVHARALFEARGATPEDMDTLDHRLRSREGSSPQRCQALSQELGPRNIRINGVSPGPVRRTPRA
jgi:hypothetical protein